MYNGQRVSAIIVAAGSSSRMGFDKLSYKIDGKSVLCRSIAAFDAHAYVDDIIVVAGENICEVKAAIEHCAKPAVAVQGGETRSKSVQNGVSCASGAFVAIHDAARPFVSQNIISAAIEAAFLHGAAAPAVPVKDTIKISNKDGMVKSTPNRDELFAVQTPQVFSTSLYKKALSTLYTKDFTDDCLLFENAGYPVYLTKGEYQNYKITTKEDLRSESKMRIGHGYDVHRLVKNRKLILGGVDIPHTTGLLGHSDADVLAHAIMDALLGAAALGDIGKLFPDNDDAYKGANSLDLLKTVCERVRGEGLNIGNVDATVLCQAPKLRPYIDTMRQKLAAAMGCDISCVGVKATTEEHLGFTGEELGIAAHAVALLV
ncbi:MAG: 2-C-methyl-D-erythritol 2,4-cyclodiphosphate synthase [Oscillospiraceae bacterium]